VDRVAGRAAVNGELDWFQVNAPLGREREARAGITMHLPL